MGLAALILIVFALGAAGYFFGRAKAVALEQSGPKPHSRHGFHAAQVMSWTLIPAFAVIALTMVAQPLVVDNAARAEFPPEIRRAGAETDLIASIVRSVAAGLSRFDEAEMEAFESGDDIRPLLRANGVILGGGEIAPYMIRAAEKRNALSETFSTLLSVFAIAAALAGLIIAWRRIRPEARARNHVEGLVKAILIAASTIAVLTTAGIVLSMLSESMKFFAEVSPFDFFFGTVWDPRFAPAGSTGDEGGQFGILPLVWGTAYISFIALLIAVPIGLFSAIYMAEYASRRMRGVIKPLIEVLAGIPTIVYGFFALITVGPFIRDVFARPLGLGDSGSSVMTAGVVMGIMIIPFISSLSDDIINAVPQSLRDGSLGLGATKSETIRQVVIPAALPGIVGAVMLAASRAIGETMIVVLAAGVATRISLNPFQEMTTVTVKIVSQLTGDTEFTSPQTLVAFALGLTLFTVTLALNILALGIVRKYREQYD